MHHSRGNAVRPRQHRAGPHTLLSPRACPISTGVRRHHRAAILNPLACGDFKSFFELLYRLPFKDELKLCNSNYSTVAAGSLKDIAPDSAYAARAQEAGAKGMLELITPLAPRNAHHCRLQTQIDDPSTATEYVALRFSVPNSPRAIFASGAPRENAAVGIIS